MKPIIPIPERLKKFPVYNGYPVFFVVAKNSAGKPQWKQLDRLKQIQCANQNLCSICGERMLTGVFWFVVGPDEHEGKCTTNGPMHEECARFSCAICPYLANANYRGSDNVLDHAGPSAAKYLIDHNMTGELIRPDKIALCSATSYTSKLDEQYPWWFVKEWSTTDWTVCPQKPTVEKNPKESPIH